MRCDGNNGYAGWKVCDVVTSQPVPYVVWVDPDDNTYCTMDQPTRINWRTGEIAQTVHHVKDFTVDVIACTFWYEKLPVTVAPLSPGRQQDQRPSNRPCDACRQPETCKRIDYCAAYRCRFGEDDKP